MSISKAVDQRPDQKTQDRDDTSAMSLLTVSHLRKSYGGAVALMDASLELRPGETLALIGENGAGKSTLIKVLAGAVAPDGGEIWLAGAATTLRAPREAYRRGLRFIHQELNVVPGLSVAENIFLGRPYPRRLRHRRLASAQRPGPLDVENARRRPHCAEARASCGYRSAIACWSRLLPPFSRTR